MARSFSLIWLSLAAKILSSALLTKPLSASCAALGAGAGTGAATGAATGAGSACATPARHCGGRRRGR